MKEIILSNGQVTQVDDEDFEYLNQWKWRLHPKGKVVRGEQKGGRKAKYNNIYMHRIVASRMGLKIESKLIDHKDQNPSNNQRNNLRLATPSQNLANRKRPKNYNKASKYKGVFTTRGIKWLASIRVSNKSIHLGHYLWAESAAMAYDLAAIKYFGEFADLNFPERIKDYEQKMFPSIVSHL